MYPFVRLLVLLALVSSLGRAAAPRPAEPPPSERGASTSPPAGDALPPEARQFDFWTGTWDVSLRIRQEDGSWPEKIGATARIYPVLGGKAVLELWDGPPIVGFSLRYFDVGLGKWVLWLNWPRAERSDSARFEGSFDHGRFEFFATQHEADGTDLLIRYTFSDVAPDRLRWDDGYSKDGGKTWSNNWIMHFTRTGKEPALPESGGAAPTWHDGNRCRQPSFRRFDSLVGRREGWAERRGEDATPKRQRAVLTGYSVLDGCAVLSFLRLEDGYESLQLHTWNTSRSVFEEGVLDGDPASSLWILRGTAHGDVLRLAEGGTDGTTRRWTLGVSGIEMEQRSGGVADSTPPSLKVTFPSAAPGPR